MVIIPPYTWDRPEQGFLRGGALFPEDIHSNGGTVAEQGHTPPAASCLPRSCPVSVPAPALPCPSQAASRWMAEAQALGPPKQQVASNERVRVDAGGPLSSWSRGGGGMVASQAQLHLLP